MDLNTEKINGVITIANTFEVRALAESGSKFFNTLDSRKTKEADGKHSNILEKCFCTKMLLLHPFVVVGYN